MIKLANALAAWGSPDFETTLKAELKGLDTAQLPLQQGLSHTSYACDGGIDVVILTVTEIPSGIRAKAGIFYSGIIAGSCCADDPTPISEQAEYCELQFDIDRRTAETTVTLLNA
ncbi:MAG: hypothetical protein JSW09_04330 [Pseudomonadota bacterium]|nr:MAG: hypothetical protein JSW09_04330 [Pseudomonadota bacterium]